MPAAGRVCKKMGKEIRNPSGEKSGIVRPRAGRRNVGMPTAGGGLGRPGPPAAGRASAAPPRAAHKTSLPVTRKGR